MGHKIIICNMIYFIDRNNTENIIIQLFLNEIGVRETFTICNIKLATVLIRKCVFFFCLVILLKFFEIKFDVLCHVILLRMSFNFALYFRCAL